MEKSIQFIPKHSVGAVVLDERDRITLGKVLPDYPVERFKVYRNEKGQILLDPITDVPAYEAWVFKNPAVKASITKGIKQAKEGKLVSLGSFAKYTKDEAED